MFVSYNAIISIIFMYTEHKITSQLLFSLQLNCGMFMTQKSKLKFEQLKTKQYTFCYLISYFLQVLIDIFRIKFFKLISIRSTINQKAFNKILKNIFISLRLLNYTKINTESF